MFSFTKIKDYSRSTAVILNKKTKKTEKVLYMTDYLNDEDKAESDFEEELEKYALSNDERNIELKPEYEFEISPPEYSEAFERSVSYITSASGSGKSYFIGKYVKKYHFMYPKNRIVYISCSDIFKDKSYSELVKKKSFLEVLFVTDIYQFNNVLKSSDFDNTLFIFDDIIDADINVDSNTIIAQMLAEKPVKNGKKAELTLADNKKAMMYSEVQGKLIKSNIIKSILELLNRGRKHGISLLIVGHNLYNEAIGPKVVSESHNVTIFPYDNVSSSKLRDYLKEYLSFSNEDSKEIVKIKFKKFEFLFINTKGPKFYILPNAAKFI